MVFGIIFAVAFFGGVAYLLFKKEKNDPTGTAGKPSGSKLPPGP